MMKNNLICERSGCDDCNIEREFNLIQLLDEKMLRIQMCFK